VIIQLNISNFEHNNHDPLISGGKKHP
jgi:hypothetical protein